MRRIYLSPHFDDAVFSCGGLIWEQAKKGMPVEIWTVCAGDPPPGPLSPLAQVCHFQWGTQTAEETVALRRVEDHNAAGIVGATTRHFTTPDCIYRRSSQGELLYTEDIFVPRNKREADLDSKIAAALTRELLPDDTVISPLAIGGHVDHILTRAAAERLGRPLLYYADIPYLLEHPEALTLATTGMKARLHPVSEEGLHFWQAGIATYASQILVLFETGEKMRAAIRGYWESSRGVRLWRIG